MLFALLCLSCSKEPVNNSPWEVISDTDIQFGIFDTAPKQSKVTPDGFESTDKINVYGYLVPDNSNVPAYDMLYVGNATNPLSFTYSQVTTNSEVTSGGKVYESAYYWPKFEQCAYQSIHFFGFYAYNTGSGSSITGPVANLSTEAAPSFSYTSNIAGNAAEEDFLVAQQSATENDVNMEFVHPLAKVEWKITYTDFIGTNGIELNFPVIGKGNFTYAAGGTEDGKGWSTANTTDSNIRLKWNGVVSGNSTEELSLGTTYLIPQQLGKFSVIYNYHKEARDISTNEDFNLEAGCSYTFTLKIQKDHVIILKSEITDSQGNKKNNQWITITNNNTI